MDATLCSSVAKTVGHRVRRWPDLPRPDGLRFPPRPPHPALPRLASSSSHRRLVPLDFCRHSLANSSLLQPRRLKPLLCLLLRGSVRPRVVPAGSDAFRPGRAPPLRPPASYRHGATAFLLQREATALHRAHDHHARGSLAGL